MSIYIEPETGSDENDGLTEATAVKTSARAWSIVNDLLRRQIPETIVITCESNRRRYLAGLPMLETP